MPKILGIEIGASKIRICEEDYKTKTPKVYNTVTVKTPAGVVNDGVLDVTEELVTLIKSALAEYKIKTKQVIFSLNSTKIASREIAIPYMKENKVKDMVAANASDYFPVDLSQYEVGHIITGVIENDNGTKQYKVQVLAVPQNILVSYHQLAQTLGMNVLAFDYSGNSIYQIIRRQCDTGVQMVVKVDETSSMITILQDQVVLLQRTVAYGAEDAAIAMADMAEYDNPSYEDAVSRLQSENCMENEDVAQSLSFLISGISRVVDYFARNNNVPIDKAYLSGFGGSFVGLADLISRALELPIEPLTAIKGTQLGKYFKNEDFGEFLTCIGAAIAPIGLLSEKEKDRKSMSLLPGEEDMFKVSILIAAACVIGAVALFTVSFLRYRTADTEQARLNDRIEELADAEAVYKDFLQERYTYTKLSYYMAQTVTFNEALVAFIEEMEEKMPASLNVQSFAANEDGVTMSVTVADKKEAAKMIQQFRTFESVAAVNVDGLTDTNAVMPGQVMDEEPKVSFSISVMYKGMGQDNAVPVIEEPAADTTQTTDATSDEAIME